MSVGINKVILLGDVVSDPKMGGGDKGYKVLKFRLSTGSSYIGKDGNKVDRNEWHSVAVWGKKAEQLAASLKSGMRVYVDGSIRSSGKGDQKSFEINANDVQIMDLELVSKQSVLQTTAFYDQADDVPF